MLITVNDVKRMAGLQVSSTLYNAVLLNLIDEMQTPIEYSIADKYLADSKNIHIQVTLKMGILQIIAGEFLEQLRVSGVTRLKDGKDLITQGATRLAPYLKGVQREG